MRKTIMVAALLLVLSISLISAGSDAVLVDCGPGNFAICREDQVQRAVDDIVSLIPQYCAELTGTTNNYYSTQVSSSGGGLNWADIGQKWNGNRSYIYNLDTTIYNDSIQPLKEENKKLWAYVFQLEDRLYQEAKMRRDLSLRVQALEAKN